MTTKLSKSEAESMGSAINREIDSYRGLPTSWVVPGIGVADEKLKVDPAEEYLLPRDRYDSLDELLESDPDTEEEINRHDRIEDIGDNTMLIGLDPEQIKFVYEYARSGSLESAGKLVGVKKEEIPKYLSSIAETMEQTMKNRRENSVPKTENI